ncbi:MAG: hypothetical protein DWQ37_11405 [Planctomycetota bacterium]|nr:MAG: hypothetical protein DWQ37_11405 [Planctomycetota bacterium]
MQRIRLADGQQHLVAKVRTEGGQKQPVDLGRVSRVERLDLREGDRVTVVGTPARINDRSILAARRIEANGESVTLGREQDRGVKRVQGAVMNLRTARLRNLNAPFLVARLQLNGGRNQTVILGPKEKLRNLDIQTGDDLQMLVRRGTLNDQPALIAEQVRTNGQTVRVQRPRRDQLDARQQQQARRGSNE